jgi:hypothetical protein
MDVEHLSSISIVDLYWREIEECWLTICITFPVISSILVVMILIGRRRLSLTELGLILPFRKLGTKLSLTPVILVSMRGSMTHVGSDAHCIWSWGWGWA